MSFKWSYGSVFVATLMVFGFLAVADDSDPPGGKTEKETEEDMPEFPSELRIDPDKMPEPVRKNVLQRIDEHERLEELLRNQPLEIERKKGTGD